MRWMTLALLATGCKVVDAPDNLEDLVVFGFEHFGESEEMEATLEALMPLLDSNSEVLSEGLRVGELTTSELSSVGIDNGDTDGIAGAMGLVPYRSGVDAVLAVIIDEDKEEQFDNMSVFDPQDLSDRACFLAHTCDTFEQLIEETVNIAILGESQRQYTNAFHWVDHASGPVVMIRSLSPDPIEFNTAIARVHQQYSVAWVLPDGDGARRVEAFWIDAEVVGLDVPDSFAVDQAVTGMRRTAETIDTIIEGI